MTAQDHRKAARAMPYQSLLEAASSPPPENPVTHSDWWQAQRHTAITKELRRRQRRSRIPSRPLPSRRKKSRRPDFIDLASLTGASSTTAPVG